MRVHYDYPTQHHFNNAVITIGTFDGVHLGHQQIIHQVIETARKVNGESVIITFHPHPRKIVSSVPGDIKLLTTLDEKIQLLEQAGIDHLVVVPFNHSFANQSAESYINEFLYQQFHPHTVIIGYDHRFGKNRSGDYHLLESAGKKLGFAVKEIDEKIINEITISSTKIRNALLEQNVKLAANYLGYPFFFTGTVVEGNKLGRTIGYPTANLHIGSEEKLIPANGVYAVRVSVEGFENQFKGMMNIGVRPTVDGKKRMIEVNIFDFDEMIYQRKITVQLIDFLRGEVKFDGINHLQTQLAHDKKDALQLLAS